MRTEGLATEVVRAEAERELADDAADVGAGLHEALRAGGERAAVVEAVLEHCGHGLVVCVSLDETRKNRRNGR